MVEQAVHKTGFLDPIIDYLAEVEAKMSLQAGGQQSDLQAALNHLLSSGGKRIRPAVTLLCGGMLGGDWDKLVILSAAIELLHTATLVHDDLIDGSLLRRGNATLNAHWTPAATVLTGDFIFARAANLAAETGSVQVMQMFANTLATIVNGELNQLFGRETLIDLHGYEQRIYAKTASLFELASSASAVLSPVDERTVELMHSFGKNIGMAFQIIDDVLDFTGSTDAVGKPVGSDLRQGLVTAPALFYFEESREYHLQEQILQHNLPETAFEKVLDSIRESDAIERSLKIAQKYIDQSRENVAMFPEGTYKQSLSGLVDFIVHRRV